MWRKTNQVLLICTNDGGIALVQGNRPVHKADVLENWFEQHTETKVLDCLSRSPDLNFIEHL